MMSSSLLRGYLSIWSSRCSALSVSTPAVAGLRRASLTSAINRGIRRSNSVEIGGTRIKLKPLDKKRPSQFSPKRSKEERSSSKDVGREPPRRSFERPDRVVSRGEDGTERRRAVWGERPDIPPRKSRRDSLRRDGGSSRFDRSSTNGRQMDDRPQRSFRRDEPHEGSMRGRFDKPFRQQDGAEPHSRGSYGQSSPARRTERFEDAEEGYGARRESVKKDKFPLSIPYTTPASEFLYGTSVVTAALKSKRRKLYKLYIYTGENRSKDNADAELEKLARRNYVAVEKVRSGEWLRLMDKMSNGRPHNGYILESSPLPRLPALSLGAPNEAGTPGFEVELDHQSREEEAVNGTRGFIKQPTAPYGLTGPGRHPFVLFLDGITDPGNLGGIIRTAAFMGVSAVATSAHGTATFTSVVLKAAAGAAESVPLLTVKKTTEFLTESQAAGWKVFAAVTPSPPSGGSSSPSSPSRAHGRRAFNTKAPVEVSSHELADPLSHYPCILMLGSEGEGLRWSLRSQADFALSIPTMTAVSGPGGHGVDSLNVSVAAGILCDAFTRRVVPDEAEAEDEAENEVVSSLVGENSEDAEGAVDEVVQVEERENKNPADDQLKLF